MKASCILCDCTFSPDPKQAKKLRKHPHRIFLCPECHQRIRERTLARKSAEKQPSIRKERH
ncbi:DUF2197 domain-containing protein [Paludifilum halophilum]|uniref:DUF2197 domain-containing protein n=1 Tax=Paludifilum halophilum TaxID=1642702 RepID=A0A235B692_9BACL|nr:DUF2197 domain-containing protein [Paludifilum halophilum]OYD07824.1 hypothetical protein CHM34_10230 [Paludifilum halophilum]